MAQVAKRGGDRAYDHIQKTSVPAWRLIIVSVSSRRRRFAALAAAALAGLTLSTLDVTPGGGGGGVGYVRLGHLSPDTPEVDVYFSSPSNAGAAKKIPGVGYGV